MSGSNLERAVKRSGAFVGCEPCSIRFTPEQQAERVAAEETDYAPAGGRHHSSVNMAGLEPEDTNYWDGPVQL